MKTIPLKKKMSVKWRWWITCAAGNLSRKGYIPHAAV